MIDFAQKIKQKISEGLPGERFQLQMAPETRYAENIIFAPEKAKLSAVLILVFEEEGEKKLVLIKRNDDGQPHSGQVAFPGGRFEEKDKSLINTALREAQEEVGVSVSLENVLGELTPLYIPVSNFKVQPVVAFCKNSPKFLPDHSEVAYIIKVKLSDLLNAEVCKKQIEAYDKKFNIAYFNLENEHVWGATSMILNEFRQILNKIQKS